MDGLGLIIAPDHQRVVNAYPPPPPRFCTIEADLPDDWEPAIPVWDQATTSSCAGHAVNTCFQHAQFLLTGESIDTSPWFCYQMSRHCAGYSGADGGTSIGSTLDSATRYGTSLLSLCPRLVLSNQQIGPQAFADAEQHKHFGELRYDLRDWEVMLPWIADRRPMVIGTTWYQSQRSITWVEDLEQAVGGNFLGYHARAGSGWTKVNGVLQPRIRNSHSRRYGRNGTTTVTRRTWEKWRSDPNFVALGFGPIQERVPERRDWSQTNAWALGSQPTIG